MRRKFAGVLAALLVFAMGTTTVFAANSPTAEDKVVEQMNNAVQDVSIKSGNTALAVTKKPLSKETLSEAAGMKENSGDRIVAMADISAPAGATGPFTVTMRIALTVTSDTRVYVIHKAPSGYERLQATATAVSDVQADVTFTSNTLSPIYIVVPAVTSGTGTGTGTGTSNPTGSTPAGGMIGDIVNSGNTTGDSTSNSQSQTQGSNSSNSNNNQSNSQTNNQNNPVNVNQNVTVNYPDGYRNGSGYDDGYSDGFNDGWNSGVKDNAGSGSSGGTNSGGGRATVTSPRTGASMPALPLLAMFAATGIAACGRRTRRGR